MRKLSLKELNRLDIQAFKQLEKAEVCIVLDNVRSALNVGSAFRTADAFAIKHLYLCGITAQPPHREILKTAIGASRSVAWSHHSDTSTLLRSLKDEDYLIWGAEQADQSTFLHQMSIDPHQKYAIVFGNEVEGVSEQVMPLLDGCVEIPQFGTKHSLNISVSLGIVLWEFAKSFHLTDEIS